MSNYKHYTLNDWIQCINMKLEYFDELDGNEMRDLVEFLSRLPRWTPVNERLPEANIAVLTYIDSGATKTYCLAYWNDMQEAWENWIGCDLIEKDRGYKVLAWMPLPEPYKAESEDAE